MDIASFYFSRQSFIPSSGYQNSFFSLGVIVSLAVLMAISCQLMSELAMVFVN